MFIKNLYTYILDTLFPNHCAVCHKEGFSICPKCLSNIPLSERLPEDIISIYQYKNPTIKRILWNLKYKGRSFVAKDLSQVMSDKIIGELEDLSIFEDMQNIFLVPLPMSKERLKERGKNHALLLCDAISEKINIQTLDCLIKTKDTKRQALIKNRSKRLSNVKNSMDMKKGFDVKGKNIVLVDDIITTGATIKEAKRVLRNYGARKIFAIVVAH